MISFVDVSRNLLSDMISFVDVSKERTYIGKLKGRVL